MREKPFKKEADDSKISLLLKNMGVDEKYSLCLVVIIFILLFGGMFISYNQCKKKQLV